MTTPIQAHFWRLLNATLFLPTTLDHRSFPDERHLGTGIQSENQVYPAKSHRQHFSSPVDPPTACRWSSQVPPFLRCRTEDGDIAPSEHPGHPATLFRHSFAAAAPFTPRRAPISWDGPQEIRTHIVTASEPLPAPVPFAHYRIGRSPRTRRQPWPGRAAASWD